MDPSLRQPHYVSRWERKDSHGCPGPSSHLPVWAVGGFGRFHVHYWDAKLGRTRQRMVQYLGACDKDGNILEAPKVHPEAVRSAFPVGRLLVFHASAEKLRVRECVRKALGIDDEMAGHFMIIVYNMDTDRVADDHLPDWARAGPLDRLLSLNTANLTPETFGKLRSAVCRLNPKTKLWEDRGPAVQQDSHGPGAT